MNSVNAIIAICVGCYGAEKKKLSLQGDRGGRFPRGDHA